MVRSAAARNRTRRATGTRDECEDLVEIDELATRAKTKKLERNDLMILDMERTCSTWNRTAAYKAGQSQTKQCDLCGQDERAGHLWVCKGLEEERKEADKEIADLDAEALPAAIKQGVAPAMMCDITKPFWGGEPSKKDSRDAKKLCGCKPEKEVSKVMRKIIDKCGGGITAREVMQHVLAEEAGEDLPLPEKLQDQEPPENPNVYSDGSLKNPGVGPHWMVGGIGVWWPGRTEEKQPRTKVEEKYTRSSFEGAGLRMWNAFNDLRNSSTRCEVGAALLAMNPPIATNIGVDNQTCVEGTNEIAEHAIRKSRTTRRTAGGAPILGGTKTKLHQKSVSKKPWPLVQHGDLWMKMEEAVIANNPKTIKLTKQKGHATEEMVREGKVREEDRDGNHQSDRAADRGVTEEQEEVEYLDWKYAARQKAYIRLMAKIHEFIINVRKGQNKKKEET